MDKLKTLPLFLVLLLVWPYFTVNADQHLELQRKYLELRRIQDRPELKILKGKIRFFDNDAPDYKMLSNSKKPTKTEKIAIGKWIELKDKCQEDIIQQSIRDNEPQDFNIPVKKWHYKNKLLAAELYAGRISYGEFERKREGYILQFQKDCAACATNINEQNRIRQEAYESAERQNRILNERQEAYERAEQERIDRLSIYYLQETQGDEMIQIQRERNEIMRGH